MPIPPGSRPPSSWELEAHGYLERRTGRTLKCRGNVRGAGTDGSHKPLIAHVCDRGIAGSPGSLRGHVLRSVVGQGSSRG